LGDPGFGLIDVLRVAVAPLVHGEEEQLVPDDRTGRPHVGLVERTTAAAGEAALVHHAAGMAAYLLVGHPSPPLDDDLPTGKDIVAAGTGHGVDHAAGAAAELCRVAAGLDLELLVERERHRREALPAIRVGHVQPVDVGHVLRHRRTAE